ncbi:hypothetical protein [Natrialba sp. PRR66]|uniref:DUF7382 domain-containing protein n=1 Tax=Natrialba sp. PRR66 TaxID=3098146 RepID=UPI002B1D5ECE|nr:hypothetical protein [Natrialba sp. PRR66]
MGSKRRPQLNSISSGDRRSFADDDRAIEGLPIRLVIALVIGVVSLGIMLQILGGIDTFEGDTEVDVEFEGDSVEIGNNDDSFSVYVVDEDGNDVSDATVVAVPGDARMDDALVKKSGDDNEVVFDFTKENLDLPPDQHTGTIEFEIQPPSGTSWADDEPNDELLVIN